jgi:hypothetical protein
MEHFPIRVHYRTLEATRFMAIDGAFPAAIVPVLGTMFVVIIALYALAFDQPEEDMQ